MRKLAVVLLLVAAVTASADQGSVTGSYSGPSVGYGLVLESTPDGKLRGNYVELGHVAVLHAIEVNGTTFTARASYDDGSERKIVGSFTRRGVRISDVPVEGPGLADVHFERL